MAGENTNPAVVVGLDTMQGIQTARILASYGISVFGLSGNTKHPNNMTRSCVSVVHTSGGGEAIVRALEVLGPTLDEKAVLYPCQDSAVATVSKHRDRLAMWYYLPLADHQLVTTLMDKVAFHEYAIEYSLPVPDTYILRNRADAELAALKLEFPCALKPAYRSPSWSANTTTKAYKLSGPDDLLDRYDEVSSWSELLFAQKWVPGGEEELFSVNAYFAAGGVPLASFVARKIRQWPPTTGQSSLGVECRNDDVLESALELFGKAQYRGLAYLEMKRDSETGRHYIVEPNIGRPTGRSAIAEAGGVELLYTSYCEATGRPLPTAREQSYGSVKWIHLRRDLQSSIYWWRRGDLTVRQWLKSIRGPKAFAMWSLNDPVPFVGDLFLTARNALSKDERARRLPTFVNNKEVQ